MNDVGAKILQHFSKRRTLVALVFFTLFATAIFRFFPGIDLAVSWIFATTDGFPLASDSFLRSVRRISINLTKALAVGLLLLWVYRLFFPRSGVVFSFSRLGYSTASLVAGPAILTNLILKDNWGRPRPHTVEAFGGENPFVLPWTISDYCATNCSFVSGETSSAVWLFTLLVFLPSRFVAWAICFVAAHVVLVSTLRIAFGGHFFSDVVLSVLLNLIVFWFVWGVFFRREGNLMPQDWAHESVAEPRFKRIANALASRWKTVFGIVLLAYYALLHKVRS